MVRGVQIPEDTDKVHINNTSGTLWNPVDKAKLQKIKSFFLRSFFDNSTYYG